MSKHADLLARTPFFEAFSREALPRLAEASSERSYRKGEFIFHQGDRGDSLFVVVEGEVKVSVLSPEGDEMVLTTLRPSEIFGELAVFDGGPRSASAQALTPTRLLSLSRTALLDVLRGDPALTDAVLRHLGRLLRRLTEQTSDLVFLDLHGRVAKLLLGLAEGSGERRDDGIALDLNLTQTDLAAMVGGSRQSVNQILRSFERRGYLELSGRTIVVKEPDLLRRRAEL